MSIPAATNSSSRITPAISITRARLSWPSFGIEIPIKDTNIQNSEFRGSERVGCFGVGLELTGSTISDYNNLKATTASTASALLAISDPEQGTRFRRRILIKDFHRYLQ